MTVPRSGVEGRDDDMLLGMEKLGRLRLAGKEVDALKLSERADEVRLTGKEVDALERVGLENDVETPE